MLIVCHLRQWGEWSMGELRGRSCFGRLVAVVLLACLLVGVAAVSPVQPLRSVYGLMTSYRFSPWEGMATTEHRPEISFQLTDFDHTARVKTMKMWLDGEEVPAEVDTTIGACYYTPPEPLSFGEHKIKVRYEFFHYYPNTLESAFTVLDATTEPFAGLDTVHLAQLEAEGIAALNRFRTAVAVTELVRHPLLSRSAQAHANYLLRHDAFMHDEEEAKEGFTGESAWERAGYFGYFGPVGEGLARFDPNPALSIDGLIDAPYHRLGLLEPYHREAGIGYVVDTAGVCTTVVNCGSREMSGEDRVLLYPYPGQTDAKAGWYDSESPDPLRFYKKEFVYTGYPVSLSIHGDETVELERKTAYLKDAAGEEVPCYIVDSSREENMKTHVFLIPHEPLAFGATYTAAVAGICVHANGERVDFAKTWSFQTLAQPEIQYAGVDTRSGQARFSLQLRNGDFADLAYTLRRGSYVYQTYNAHGNEGHNYNRPLENGYYELDVTSSYFPQPINTAVEISGSSGDRQVRLLDRAAIPAGALREPFVNNTGGIVVLIDGDPLTFDVPPALIGGYVFVPVGKIFEALGLSLNWDDASGTVTATGSGTVVSLTVGSKAAMVNGRSATLAVSPVLSGGRVLVPVRFIAESTGADVDWFQADQTVRITSH